MRISINWLKEFSDCSGNPLEIANQLTMLGLEAEMPLDRSALGDIVVGEVRKKVKHPDADRLSLCEVFDGKKVHTVVCGAPNVKKGQKVPFAPVGALLPGDIKISKAKIRGEVSRGMICSERELGISDEHDGIMVLDSTEVPGSSFLNYLDTHLDQLELDITPNRPDCFSHMGVARDLAVQNKTELNIPDYSPRDYKKNETDSYISIYFENPDDCPRYIAGVVENVSVGDSPEWLKNKLESVGQRSINNIVDISNFVLMEMGHPTHIFDYDQLGSKEIMIRRGKKGEKIITLDEVERKISSNELLITNGKDPVAIAGIMGGLDSSVTKKTKTLLIESAYFDPPTIRRGAKRLGMHTDASKRFERGADPNGAEKAFWRVISLLESVTEGKWVPGIVDPYPKEIVQNEIILNRDKLDILSGADIPDVFVVDTLKGIGCKVKGKANTWKCIPPSWRPDIEREVDLIEEVIRIYGYDKIPSKYHYEAIMQGEQPDPHNSLSNIISIISGFGFTQLFNNSLQSDREVGVLDFPSVKMMNPLSDEMDQLRTSLFPGLLLAADFNVKNGHPDLMLFEWGNVFEREGDGLDGIEERLHLSGITHGQIYHPSIHRTEGRNADFFVIKGVIDGLLSRLQAKTVSYEAIDSNPYGFEKCFKIIANNEEIGHMGQVAPVFQKNLNLDINITYGFQFNLTALMSLSDQELQFKRIVTFPIVERDLNFVIDESTQVGDIISTIENNESLILIRTEPVNLFKSDSLGDGKKSVTIKLVFQSSTKTLEDKDVNSVIDEIIKVISNDFGAKLR